MRQFSDAHPAALGVLALTVGVSVWAARAHPGRWTVPAARALALALLFAVKLLTDWVRRRDPGRGAEGPQFIPEALD